MSAYLQTFKQRIDSKEAVIAVVGMGYVGLPLALRFCEAGYKVLGFDVDAYKVQKLNVGESYIKHIFSDKVAEAWKAGLLTATTDFARIPETDAVILCVPTPLGKSAACCSLPWSSR